MDKWTNNHSKAFLCWALQKYKIYVYLYSSKICNIFTLESKNSSSPCFFFNYPSRMQLSSFLPCFEALLSSSNLESECARSLILNSSSETKIYFSFRSLSYSYSFSYEEASSSFSFATLSSYLSRMSLINVSSGDASLFR